MFSPIIRCSPSVASASIDSSKEEEDIIFLRQHSKAMNLTKIPLKSLTVLFISGTCLASIIIDVSRSKESSSIIEAASKIMKSCYGSGVGSIGVAGNSPDSLIASLMSSEDPASVLVLDDSKRSVNSGPVSRMSRHKLEIFIVMASSSMELERILVEIKKSRWWNHMANFYIIDWPVNEPGCSTRAYEILWAAWKMNLLEAKFMCIDRTKGRLIYSFNPYTRDAPDPWKMENTYRGFNDHPWALLVRAYRDNNEICKNIDFDKTKDVGGYEIRVSVSEQMYDTRLDANKTGIDSLGGTAGDIMRSLFHALNATVNFMNHPSTELLTFVDNRGILQGVLAETADGISDIGLIKWNPPEVMNLTFTYPSYFSGMCVMTQYRGHQSQLRKLISVIDVRSRIGVCLVFLISLIFLKFFVRQTRATAIFNIIRMICNMALTNLPGNAAARFYLTSLFMFIVTIQAIYQGQLASLLSKQKPLKNVNTMSDLAESDHTIYGFHATRILFSDPQFEGRFVGIDSYNCTEYVLRDSSAACVGIRNILVSEAARTKLHLSSHFIDKGYGTYAIREDWPLERKMNSLLQSLVEGNIFHYTYEKSFEKPLRTIDANNEEDSHQGLKVFNLGDLGFAFAILGIGLACATISFIVEVAIG